MVLFMLQKYTMQHLQLSKSNFVLERFIYFILVDIVLAVNIASDDDYYYYYYCCCRLYCTSSICV